MKLQNNWRKKSLETLENHNWGDPAVAPTNLVRRCMELSKVPIDNFSLRDLRLMIGQKFGLPFLIPIALEKLKNNIFLEADLYVGDLLANVLNIDTSFWDDNELYWKQLNKLMEGKRKKMVALKISTQKFDNTKFGKTKDCR